MYAILCLDDVRITGSDEATFYDVWRTWAAAQAELDAMPDWYEGNYVVVPLPSYAGARTRFVD